MLLPKRYLRPKLRSSPVSPRSPPTNRSLYEADFPMKVHMSPKPADPRLKLDLTALRKIRRIPFAVEKRALGDKEKPSFGPLLPRKLTNTTSETGLQVRKRMPSLADFTGQQGAKEGKSQEKGNREHTNEGSPIARNTAKRSKNRRTASYPSHLYLNFIRPLIPHLPFSFCPR